MRHSAFATALRNGGGCDEFGCGGNSPIVDGAVIQVKRRAGFGSRAAGSSRIMTKTALLVAGTLLAIQAPGLANSTVAVPSAGRPFHELNVDGLPNQVGLSILRIQRHDTPYALDIDGVSVVARPSDSRLPALSGRDLIGLTLALRDATGARSRIDIADVGSIVYWAGPAEPVATFALSTRAIRTPTRSRCAPQAATTRFSLAVIATTRRTRPSRRPVRPQRVGSTSPAWELR